MMKERVKSCRELTLRMRCKKGVIFFRFYFAVCSKLRDCFSTGSAAWTNCRLLDSYFYTI